MFNFISKFTAKKSAPKTLADRLEKSRKGFADRLFDFVIGKKSIDKEVFDKLYSLLLMSDMGAKSSAKVLEEVRSALSRKVLADQTVLFEVLSQVLIEKLQPFQREDLVLEKPPHVILMVGINGVGKTTTIGKLCGYYRKKGRKLLLASGDTFRAAAIEQLQVWAERNQVPIVSQQQGSDSAAVIFDAYKSAKAQSLDMVLADTAGRLHTKDNLMSELGKINKVLRRFGGHVPQDVWLVLDATTGQNGLNQAKKFQETLGLTGVVITKLDGTAKGGVIFSVVEELGVPVRFIGVGEGMDDLIPFNAKDFVEALLSQYD
ncbi:MAG TPA: signal recognition particle-docking protein FtsY [Gammaproteobacteria bacterium]|nr:signal recognition particle-docking protein FtsY [Gammaproteobacteria bacterium]